MGHKYSVSYNIVGVDGEAYLAHRLAFIYMTGECPEFVDHIDCNPLNNKFTNLRPATFSENQHNSKLRRNNTSGVKGVSFDKINNRWRCQIKSAGKFFVKYFKTFKEAARHQPLMYKKIHGDFSRSS